MKTLLCQDIASKVEMGDMKSSMKKVKNTFENVFRVSTQPKKMYFRYRLPWMQSSCNQGCKYNSDFLEFCCMKKGTNGFLDD